MAKKKKIRALILAGGLGTRLYPVTLEIPKPLLTVRRKPIINYLIEFFALQDINEIALLISQRHFEDFKWWYKRYKSELPLKRVKFFLEQKPLGTFGGVLHIAKEWLEKADLFFLTNGDEIKFFDLDNMLSFHLNHGLLGTVALVKVKNPSSYGVAVLEKQKVERFLEKPKNPPTHYINSGLYLFDKLIFDYLKDHRDLKRRKFIMAEKDILPRLAKDNQLAGFRTKGHWFDCGTFERWEETIKAVKKVGWA